MTAIQWDDSVEQKMKLHTYLEALSKADRTAFYELAKEVTTYEDLKLIALKGYYKFLTWPFKSPVAEALDLFPDERTKNLNLYENAEVAVPYRVIQKWIVKHHRNVALKAASVARIFRGGA